MTAKQWQRVIGHLISLEKLVPRGRLHLRPAPVRLASCWNQWKDPPHRLIEIPPNVREEFRWWLVPSHTNLGVPFKRPTPKHVIHTDASGAGWGAHLQETLLAGTWTQEEA